MSDSLHYSTRYSRQAATAKEDSGAVVDRSNTRIGATQVSIHSVHFALAKSGRAIAASRRLLATQPDPYAAWRRRGF